MGHTESLGYAGSRRVAHGSRAAPNRMPGQASQVGLYHESGDALDCYPGRAGLAGTRGNGNLISQFRLKAHLGARLSFRRLRLFPPFPLWRLSALARVPTHVED